MSDEAGEKFEKSLQRMSSALSPPGPEAALVPKEPPLPMRIGTRAMMVLSAALTLAALKTGHPGLMAVTMLPALIGGLVFFRDGLARRGFLPRTQAITFPASASIGLGVSIGRGAQIAPGAIVEMGADIGENAIIEAGAVVRMGASIHANAVIERGAIISWGADVEAGARVCADARIGAGATIGPNAVVPANTWVMPGGDWHGGDARENAKPTSGDRSPEAMVKMLFTKDARFSASHLRGAAGRDPDRSIAHADDSNPAPRTDANPAVSAPAIDPRQARLDAVFARIDAELLLAPAQAREHLGPSVNGVRGLKETCKSLLERERNLRAEASPEALAQLAAEKETLAKRIAATDDEQVKLSLGSAVAAIEEQVRQRQLLARSADRLDAELTRLFWTLDALAAQLVRMRSAGTEAAVAPDAALEKSVQELQGEIDAIADALEQVAEDDRRASAPMSAEHASAPPGASGARGGAAENKKVRG